MLPGQTAFDAFMASAAQAEFPSDKYAEFASLTDVRQADWAAGEAASQKDLLAQVAELQTQLAAALASTDQPDWPATPTGRGWQATKPVATSPAFLTGDPQGSGGH